MNLDEAWAVLTRETSLSQKEWLDLLSLPEGPMRTVLQTYKDADWTRPGTSAGKAVLSALPVIAQAMGIVSGVGLLVGLLMGAPAVPPGRP